LEAAVNALKELNGLWIYPKRIAGLRDKIGELTGRINAIRKLPKDGLITEDPTGNTAAELGDLRTVYRRECRMYARRLGALLAWTERVKDPTVAAIVRLRYVERLDWEDVAEELGYSRRHLSRLLRAFGKK
jgi:CRP-like cAMP-binding protein